MHRVDNCHRVDWHQASAAATGVIRQARREGLAGRAISGRAAELAEAQDLPAQEKEALGDLLAELHRHTAHPGSSAATLATATAATASPRCSTAASAPLPSFAGDTPAEAFRDHEAPALWPGQHISRRRLCPPPTLNRQDGDLAVAGQGLVKAMAALKAAAGDAGLHTAAGGLMAMGG